jgi:hypothetical protein
VAVGVVGVDHELGLVADGLAGDPDAMRVALRVAPDLNLRARDARVRPGGEQARSSSS